MPSPDTPAKRAKMAPRSFEAQCIEATFDFISSPGDFIEWCKLHQVDGAHGQFAVGRFLTTLPLASGHGWIWLTALSSSGDVKEFIRSLNPEAQKLLFGWLETVNLWATYNISPSS